MLSSHSPACHPSHPLMLPRCVARPGNLPRSPDEMQKKRHSSGFSPQKRGWEAQSRGGEPSGFARRPCFESMAVLFAIDDACLPTSVRRAYLPHAAAERSSRRDCVHPQDDVLVTRLRITCCGAPQDGVGRNATCDD